MKKVLIFAGVLTVIGGLAWYLKNQANLLLQYCLNFVGYKIITLNKDRITIQVDVQFQNKSNLEIDINSYNFNAYLNGVYVTKISSNKLQKIKPKDFSVLYLMIDIEPKKSKELANWDFLSRILLDVNNIKLKIQGSVSVSALGISANEQPVVLEKKLKEMLPDPKKATNSNCK